MVEWYWLGRLRSWFSSSSSSFFLHWHTINASFRNIAHFRSVFCSLPPFLDTCRLFSIPPSHTYFGLSAFLLPSGFPRNICFTESSSDILTRWPAQWRMKYSEINLPQCRCVHHKVHGLIWGWTFWTWPFEIKVRGLPWQGRFHLQGKALHLNRCYECAQLYRKKQSCDFSSVSRIFRPESADSNFHSNLRHICAKLHGVTFKRSVFVMMVKYHTYWIFRYILALRNSRIQDRRDGETGRRRQQQLEIN